MKIRVLTRKLIHILIEINFSNVCVVMGNGKDWGVHHETKLTLKLSKVIICYDNHDSTGICCGRSSIGVVFVW